MQQSNNIEGFICKNCKKPIKEGILLNGQLWKIIDGENKGGLLGRDYPPSIILNHTEPYLFCNKCFINFIKM
jgi:hypothetical protein